MFTCNSDYVIWRSPPHGSGAPEHHQEEALNILRGTGQRPTPRDSPPS